MELTVKDLQKLQSAHPDYRDVSFVRSERLRQSPRSFAELAPDLMVEVKSPTDSLKKVRQKITNFLALGTQVGILVDPETRTV
ncbi:MAG: Uma2 family endonuclease [Cyanobacteria bacterium P01_F01_bin.86]